MMTNDTSTYVGAKQEAIDRLENNLAAMGVTASYDRSQGYYVLLDEILNISGSVGGITLETALSIQASSTTVTYGTSITLSGILSCSYDDISQADDDMRGYIQHGSVKIYDGNTLIDTVQTDNDGAYSATLTLAGGVHSLMAVYDGTDFYEDCYSSSVSVTVNDYMELTSDKSILSKADNEYATLTATLHSEDKVGKTITYEVYKENHTPSTLVVDTDITTPQLLTGEITDVEFNNTDYGAIRIGTDDADDSMEISINPQNNGLTIYAYSTGITATYTVEGTEFSTKWLRKKLYEDYSYIPNGQFKEIVDTYESQNNNMAITYDEGLVETLFGTTNSSGIATVSYFGKGVGDLNIKAECMLFIQTYSIQDCYRYYPTIQQSAEILLDDSNIPSEFIMSFTAKTTARTSSICWAIFNSQYRTGIADSGGYCGIVAHTNGAWITKLDNQLPLNIDKEISCKFENGTWTVSWDSYSITNSNLSAPNTLNKIQTTTNIIISNFKIKPL